MHLLVSHAKKSSSKKEILNLIEGKKNMTANVTTAGLTMGDADILIRQKTRAPNKMDLYVLTAESSSRPDVAFINEKNGFLPEPFEDWQTKFMTESMARLSKEFNIDVGFTLTPDLVDLPLIATSEKNRSALSGVGGRENFYDGKWLIMTLGVGKGVTPDGQFVPGPHTEDSMRGWKSIWLHELGHAVGLEHPWDRRTADENTSQHDDDFDVASRDDAYAPTLMGYKTIPVVWDEWYRPIDLYTLANIWGVAGTTDTISNYFQREKVSAVESETTPLEFTYNLDGTTTITKAKLLLTATGTNTANSFLNTYADEVIDGSGGVDQFLINVSSDKVNLSTLTDGSLQLTYTGGSVGGLDKLSSVERLVFSDTKKAFDITGSAGQTAKVIVAIMGPAGLSNKGNIGLGLQLFDSGQSIATICDLALNAVGATTNQQVVDLLFTNLFGVAPKASESKVYVDVLNAGLDTTGSLAAAAAELTDDLGVLDLVGLAETGIEFI